MSDKSLKVTDRRMFTPDGKLRSEYRDMEGTPASGAESQTESRRAAAPAAPPAAQPPPAGRIADPTPEPVPPDSPDAPGFFDLVGLLAEPATIYLREAQGADPQTAAQSLELARVHIDLLAVLRTKTEGNLSSEEHAMLDDVIYQLRSGYVGLRG